MVSSRAQLTVQQAQQAQGLNHLDSVSAESGKRKITVKEEKTDQVASEVIKHPQVSDLNEPGPSTKKVCVTSSSASPDTKKAEEKISGIFLRDRSHSKFKICTRSKAPVYTEAQEMQMLQMVGVAIEARFEEFLGEVRQADDPYEVTCELDWATIVEDVSKAGINVGKNYLKALALSKQKQLFSFQVFLEFWLVRFDMNALNDEDELLCPLDTEFTNFLLFDNFSKVDYFVIFKRLQAGKTVAEIATELNQPVEYIQEVVEWIFPSFVEAFQKDHDKYIPIILGSEDTTLENILGSVDGLTMPHLRYIIATNQPLGTTWRDREIVKSRS